MSEQRIARCANCVGFATMKPQQQATITPSVAQLPNALVQIVVAVYQELGWKCIGG
jgi:hypothetical protein